MDGFPKDQRFVLGTRLADTVVLVVELLAEAAYAGRGRKKDLLAEANRKIEVTRWLVRLAADRNLISNRQFVHSCRSLEECGRMGGRLAQVSGNSGRCQGSGARSIRRPGGVVGQRFTESFRMLEVVETPDGPRVDWDSYARYCSANWDDLLAGRVVSAEVRVFVSPGDYHNVPFADEGKWTCFRLMSPDLPEGRDVFAYLETGSPRETQLRRIVLRALQFRQHLTLQITGRETAGGGRLFEITRVLAVGWVRGDQDIDEAWSAP